MLLVQEFGSKSHFRSIVHFHNVVNLRLLLTVTLTLEWDPSLIQIMLFFTLETNELLLSSFMGLSTYHNNFFDFYILFFLLLPGDSFKDVFTAASTRSPLCPSLTSKRSCTDVVRLPGRDLPLFPTFKSWQISDQTIHMSDGVVLISIHQILLSKSPELSSLASSE